jgi:uncharacterized protein YjbJ (UPF0337 family)
MMNWRRRAVLRYAVCVQRFHEPAIRPKERKMNKDIIEGNWKELKGKVKEQWGKLTDDRLDVIAGRRDQLAGEIQQAYGISREEAEKQIKEFEEATKR